MLKHRRSQSGVLLLEVLIALLIFALGVLGLVGLQANAIKQSGQAKYRADATLLANDLIGQMWITSRDYATLNAAFTSTAPGGPNFLAWKTRVEATLPGATSYPPTVALAQIAPLDAIAGGASAPATPGLTASTRVTITMRWKAPGEPAADPAHSFVLTNEIK
jgi:type IV pilus assembly protein PilV